jgi:anthranilate 1,2-dioxygenase (deaminating, decarboxylating) large subunit
LLVVGVCLLLTALLATPVGAFDQPSVNLGFTSFMDGGPPAGPGWYFQEYIQYYSGDELEGNPISPNTEVDVWVSLNQLIYQSDQELFLGGKWGLNVIVPVINIDADDPLPPQLITDNGFGVGDVWIGPFIQWDPIMGSNGPRFMHRIELQCILPTGKYSASNTLNQGSNFLSFNPYWAGTYWFTPKLTGSFRAHYLWNGKNDDPWKVFQALGARETEAGDAYHVNFALSYEVLPKQLRAGINGYYLRQTTASEFAGSDISGREQVLGIGPGAMWSFSQETHLFFNAYFEDHVHSRPEGDRFVVRLVHHF